MLLQDCHTIGVRPPPDFAISFETAIATYWDAWEVAGDWTKIPTPIAARSSSSLPNAVALLIYCSFCYCFLCAAILGQQHRYRAVDEHYAVDFERSAQCDPPTLHGRLVVCVGVRYFSSRTTGPDTGSVTPSSPPKSSSVSRKELSVAIIFDRTAAKSAMSAHSAMMQ